MTEVIDLRVEAAVKAWQDFVNEASIKATGKELRVDARNVREGLVRVLKAADAVQNRYRDPGRNDRGTVTFCEYTRNGAGPASYEISRNRGHSTRTAIDAAIDKEDQSKRS